MWSTPLPREGTRGLFAIRRQWSSKEGPLLNTEDLCPAIYNADLIGFGSPPSSSGHCPRSRSKSYRLTQPEIFAFGALNSVSTARARKLTSPAAHLGKAPLLTDLLQVPGSASLTTGSRSSTAFLRPIKQTRQPARGERCRCCARPGLAGLRRRAQLDKPAGREGALLPRPGSSWRRQVRP